MQNLCMILSTNLSARRLRRSLAEAEVRTFIKAKLKPTTNLSYSHFDDKMIIWVCLSVYVQAWLERDQNIADDDQNDEDDNNIEFKNKPNNHIKKNNNINNPEHEKVQPVEQSRTDAGETIINVAL